MRPSLEIFLFIISQSDFQGLRGTFGALIRAGFARMPKTFLITLIGNQEAVNLQNFAIALPFSSVLKRYGKPVSRGGGRTHNQILLTDRAALVSIPETILEDPS
jgi:hypothetical protein